MNFQSRYGNDSEQKCSQKRERISSSMHQAVAIPTCARRSQLICVIVEVRVVIRTRSSLPAGTQQGDDDQRDGPRKPRRGRVDRRSRILTRLAESLASPARPWFHGLLTGKESRSRGSSKQRSPKISTSLLLINSARHDDESPREDGFNRFCAHLRRLHFRGRS